jgi:hypothetical protein
VGQQLLIVGVRKLEPIEQSADRWCFWSAKPFVLQIQVVHNRSDPLEGGMAHSK